MHSSLMLSTASHPAYHVLLCLLCADTAAQMMCFAARLLRYDVQRSNPTHKTALYGTFLAT